MYIPFYHILWNFGIIINFLICHVSNDWSMIPRKLLESIMECCYKEISKICEFDPSKKNSKCKKILEKFTYG